VTPRTVARRLGERGGFDVGRFAEVRDGARDSQYPVTGARRVVALHRPEGSPRSSQGHPRVVFLPFAHVRLPCRKPKYVLDNPKTLGDPTRKRRIDLGLTLKQAAARLGVADYRVINREHNRTEPPVAAIPAVVRFRGYDSFPTPTALAERLLGKRRATGWTIKQAARTVGVDPGA
jgi:hypothetical protein